MAHAYDFGPRGLPVAGDPKEGELQLAPPPLVDRYPIVIGQALSLSYVSSVLRLATTGFRQQYVDLLDEMLEKDPATYAVVSKRAGGVAGGRFELEAAAYKEGTPDAKMAAEVRQVCSDQIAAVEDFDRALSGLSWGVFYGLTGLENHWRRDGSGWAIDRFSFLHSRRLAYPKSTSWDLHVWDQGTATSYGYGAGAPASPFYPNVRRTAPTEGYFGLRVADYAGKFTVYGPQVRGDYPTREGLGREVLYWMCLKLIASRRGPEYLERYANPFFDVTFATEIQSDANGKPVKREASKEEIADAKSAAISQPKAWAHPDTVSADFKTPDGGAGSKLTYAEWISICDSQIAKAVLGGTLTTDPGTKGARSLGDTQRRAEIQLFRQDASQLAASFRRDVIRWIVLLNFGEDAARRYTPTVRIHVEDDPDPMLVIERAVRAAGSNVPVDARWLADEVGLKLVADDDEKAIRMFPIGAVKAPESFDEDLREREERLNEEHAPPPGALPPGAEQQLSPAATDDGAAPPRDADGATGGITSDDEEEEAAP